MISLLAAYTKYNHIIGAQGKIPWNLPSERDFFKKVCNKKFVIMGRKSFEEIGHALSYCTLIIVSKTLENNIPGCLVASSLDEAIALAKKNQKSAEEEILVAGGASIYKQTIDLASRIYATEIDLKIEGDSFFPEINSQWKKTILETKTENGISYDYVLYEK